MSYIIEWHPGAFKNLRRLPKAAVKRILCKLDDIAQVPYRYAEHFEDACYFKIRIGGYRLIVDIDNSKKLILIRMFDKRGRVY